MSEEKKKSCRCGKTVKIVVWLAVGGAAFVLLAVATLPLWVSPVVTGVAGFMVPKYTGTPFAMERFYINPWTGALRIAGVELSNPDGFGKYEAFSVKSVSVDLDIKDLFSNRLHVKDVEIDGAFASYFSHNRKNNFEVIMDNVEQALGSKGEEKDKKEAKAKADADSGEGMKILIDRIRIAGTSVKIMESDLLPPLPIMTIELKDIGKDSDGVKFGDAGKVIADAFMKAMSSMGGGLNALGGAFGEGMGNLSKSAKDFGAATDKSAKEVSAALEKAGGSAVSAVTSVGDGAKSAAKSVGDGTVTAIESVGDGAMATVESVGDGAKAAVDAVGNTTKKAADGVKNLLKGFRK